MATYLDQLWETETLHVSRHRYTTTYWNNSILCTSGIVMLKLLCCIIKKLQTIALHKSRLFLHFCCILQDKFFSQNTCHLHVLLMRSGSQSLRHILVLICSTAYNAHLKTANVRPASFRLATFGEVLTSFLRLELLRLENGQVAMCWTRVQHSL